MVTSGWQQAYSSKVISKDMLLSVPLGSPRRLSSPGRMPTAAGLASPGGRPGVYFGRSRKEQVHCGSRSQAQLVLHLAELRVLVAGSGFQVTRSRRTIYWSGSKHASPRLGRRFLNYSKAERETQGFVIYQATLEDDRWSGRADFLRKVDAPVNLGSWSSRHSTPSLPGRPRRGRSCSSVSTSSWLSGAAGLSCRGIVKLSTIVVSPTSTGVK